MTGHGQEPHGNEFDARWRSAWDGPPADMTVNFANMPSEPSFPAAESAVLGAVMLSASAADKLLPFLKSEHFTSRPHRDTLTAIQDLWARQQPVDPVLVHDQLRSAGHVTWGETKAAVFIQGCLEATYFPGNGASYARTLLEYAARRRAVQTGVRIAQAAACGRGELHDLMRLVTSEVHQLADEVSCHEVLSARAITPTSIKSSVDELRDDLEAKRGNQPLRVVSPLDAPSESLNGF